jgi:hypothetical protein
MDNKIQAAEDIKDGMAINSFEEILKVALDAIGQAG